MVDLLCHGRSASPSPGDAKTNTHFEAIWAGATPIDYL
jgi:hypothetical protein